MGACPRHYNPYDISSAQWDTFIENRSSGAIDARGNAVAEKDRKAVRARSVEADCIWLWLVFNWATNRKLGDKRYLMRENPARGFDMPKEKNPLRPVATQDRYETLRAVTDSSMMEVRPNGKRIIQRSYLSELLDIVVGTGRRIVSYASMICSFPKSLRRMRPSELFAGQRTRTKRSTKALLLSRPMSALRLTASRKNALALETCRSFLRPLIPLSPPLGISQTLGLGRQRRAWG